jgi:hypothetical protein
VFSPVGARGPLAVVTVGSHTQDSGRLALPAVANRARLKIIVTFIAIFPSLSVPGGQIGFLYTKLTISDCK